jgi:hypothetical protein
MIFCDYLVLEYASSELQSECISFAVVLHLDEADSCGLKGYVLRDWESTLHLEIESERYAIQTLLGDLQSFSQTNKRSSRAFFERLSTLNVGPIRTFVTGACALEDLDSALPSFFNGNISASSWVESFITLQTGYLIADT